MSTKIENATYNNEDIKEPINVDSLDTLSYETKYRGHLTCINECKARIKFTQRKNNFKFFSTWNGEGKLHNEGCPYNVNYKGKVGRKKLKTHYESNGVDTAHIIGTLNRKMKELRNLHLNLQRDKIEMGTKTIENVGNAEIDKSIDNKMSEVSAAKQEYIMSIDAKYLDATFVDTRRCVYGKLNNVQFKESGNEYYAYCNFDKTKYGVSAYLPVAFYNTENNSLEKFREFITIITNEINNGKELLFIGVGFINYKKIEGLSIYILDKDHLIINEMSYDEILNKGKIDKLGCVK